MGLFDLFKRKKKTAPQPTLTEAITEGVEVRLHGSPAQGVSRSAAPAARSTAPARRTSAPSRPASSRKASRNDDTYGTGFDPVTGAAIYGYGSYDSGSSASSYDSGSSGYSSGYSSGSYDSGSSGSSYSSGGGGSYDSGSSGGGGSFD